MSSQVGWRDDKPCCHWGQPWRGSHTLLLTVRRCFAGSWKLLWWDEILLWLKKKFKEYSVKTHFNNSISFVLDDICCSGERETLSCTREELDCPGQLLLFLLTSGSWSIHVLCRRDACMEGNLLSAFSQATAGYMFNLGVKTAFPRLFYSLYPHYMSSPIHSPYSLPD